MRRAHVPAIWGILVPLMAIIANAEPAGAALVNSITVTAAHPGTEEKLSQQGTASVDVAAAAPGLEIAVATELSTDADGDGLGDAGDVVTYSYSVRNTGNVTIGGLAIRVDHDGTGDLPVPIFTQWTEQAGSPDTDSGAVTVTMVPGAEARFQIAYTIEQADLNAAGGGELADDDIDSSAAAVGRYNSSDGPAEFESAQTAAKVPLDIVRSIAVTNLAEPASGASAGQVITYTYTITNDGNVPVTGITIAQDHNGSGDFAAPDPDSAILTDNNIPEDSANDNPDNNQWDVLGPGDVLTLTATYVVTQDDIDNLQ